MRAKPARVSSLQRTRTPDPKRIDHISFVGHAGLATDKKNDRATTNVIGWVMHAKEYGTRDPRHIRLLAYFAYLTPQPYDFVEATATADPFSKAVTASST